MDNAQKNTPSAEKRQVFLSPAKVNLFLKVLSKRPDGYHEIRSLMQPVSLYDEVTIEVVQGDGIFVSSDHAGVPGGRDNLAYRAAERLLDAVGVKRKVSISIGKKIPVGAGLGGGSSDAATVLMGLNSLLGCQIDDKRLMGLGAGIGSDVPFFILKGPALASGRGEILKRVKLPRYNYVLVNPGFHVSTAWAYNNLDLTKKTEDNILIYSEEHLDSDRNIRDFLYNDLEAVTAVRYPEITAIKRALVEEGAQGSLMSGSGPTVFGVFQDAGNAEAAFERLKVTLDRAFSVFLAHGL
ncbi:MAG: 4-(cytidine 5'-diphospho)-2-C-methyl-D-erythritol kinase [Deltaproteobacteria bacterium]|nr:4-(cytidine 5'-diphospho)-2-C-methyl-D-erythritol kinase [Deltaproteobacteria bacterium]